MTVLNVFDTALNNVEASLKQYWYNVVSTLCYVVQCATLFRRCFIVGNSRCINDVQRWKSDVGFCFIFNIESALFQRWNKVDPTLKCSPGGKLMRLCLYLVREVIQNKFKLKYFHAISGDALSVSKRRLRVCWDINKLIRLKEYFTAYLSLMSVMIGETIWILL